MVKSPKKKMVHKSHLSVFMVVQRLLCQWYNHMRFWIWHQFLWVWILSSPSTFREIASKNLSRSVLISSMFIVAITSLSWKNKCISSWKWGYCRWKQGKSRHSRGSSKIERETSWGNAYCCYCRKNSMLTFINLKPIFLSSPSTFREIASKNLSRSVYWCAK